MSYFDPARVEKVGKQVSRVGGEHPRVHSGKRLIAVLYNGMRKLAPDVTSNGEWREFYGQYYGGHWLSMDLYEVDESAVDRCRQVQDPKFQSD
ncbi:MAG TPA: hypothetical protein VJJ22_02400 [Candidatus Paceibacterota bacterium]